MEYEYRLTQRLELLSDFNTLKRIKEDHPDMYLMQDDGEKDIDQIILDQNQENNDSSVDKSENQAGK